MFAVCQWESGAKCFSYATVQHTALVCSPAWGTKAEASSSLNKDAASLPHGDLGPVWPPRLPFSSQWKIPPVAAQEHHQCGFSELRNGTALPSLTSINSPIIPSELPFTVCVSFSLPLTTMISLSVAHTGWRGVHWPVNQNHSAAVLYTELAATALSQLSSFLSNRPFS